MKRYRIVAASAGVSVGCVMLLAAGVYAADPQVGTWKLNLAKSKYDPANVAPKSQTNKIEAVGGGQKTIADRVDAQGKAVHYEFTAKYDGKDYPVTGDPTNDTVAIKKVDDHTFELTDKKGGRVTTTIRIVYSRDGKSRTAIQAGTNAQGQKVSNTTVWDRQ